MPRAVFLDLGGTLVQPILVDHPRQLTPVPDAADAVRRLNDAGFICPVITIQSRIEKGIFTASEFSLWFTGFAGWMKERGGRLLGPYVCPHRPRSRCVCAKPATLLHERAAREWDINLRESFTIGDTVGDVEAAIRFGGKGCLLASPAAVAQVAHFTAPTLSEAVDWILRQR